MKNKKLKARLRVLEGMVLDLNGRVIKMERERSRWTYTGPNPFVVPSAPVPATIDLPPEYFPPDTGGGGTTPFTIGDPYISPNISWSEASPEESFAVEVEE